MEMLVVLAVLGLAGSLVVPMSIRQVESWQRHSEANALFAEIALLPWSAREQGLPLDIGAGPYDAKLERLSVKEGWVVIFDRPLRVLQTGACLGTSGKISKDGYVQTFEMDPPYCRVRRTGTRP